MSSMVFGGYASRSVDGNGGGGNFVMQTCSHTSRSVDGSPNWIVVDLGTTYDNLDFLFTGRSDCCPFQSTNWVVKVGDSPHGNPTCTSDFDFYGGKATALTCDDGQPRSGRYVEMTSNRPMVLCEIEVFESLPNFGAAPHLGNEELWYHLRSLRNWDCSGCRGSSSGPCKDQRNYCYRWMEPWTRQCPPETSACAPACPTLGKRCGPKHYDTLCATIPGQTYAMYCNEGTGWCGNTDAHRDAQQSTKYDST